MLQRAAIAAWNEETHVTEVRARYRDKRDLLLPALESMGLRSAGGDASFFLWMEGSDELAARWLERGVIVAPGSFFGPAGAGYLRLALVPPLEAIERAIELMRVSRSRAERRSSPATFLSAATPRRCRCASCAGTAARSRRSARGP